MQCRTWPCLIMSLFLAIPLLNPAAATAQTKTAQARNDQKRVSEKPVSNEKTRQQLLEIEGRLKALKQPPAHQPVVSQQTQAFVIVEDSLKDVKIYRTPTGTHSFHFFTRLVLVNQSSQPLKLIRNQIKVKVDGQAYQFTGQPKNLSNQSVLLAKRNKRLNSLKMEDEVLVPPGKQGSLWIVLSDLPASSHIPEIEIQTSLNGQPVSLNVNRFELGKLKHTVQLLGPNQCLAELTVAGELNSINIGGLMHEVDQLTAKNIKRFVIHFPNQNPNLDPAVIQWLPRAAGAQNGLFTIVEPPFPLFPRMIRELHLSGEVFQDEKPSYLGRPRSQVTHATEEEAIHAALDSAMEILSREQISEQIRNGSPSVKVAALTSGSRQLTNEELPLVLEYTTHQNPKVQEAALYALRYFGDPRAFERLAKVANAPPGPSFEMAVASLAESRFAEGQTLLLRLLKRHPPESQKVIVGIIAQSPRPQWGDAIYAFLSSDNQELRQAAMKALILNGHPKLFEVLTNALNSPHTELREAAFLELIKRKDAESEVLAMKYILAKLQQTAPSQEMLAFIDRLKDPRAIPLLFQHLQDPELDAGIRVSVIKILASIGDQTVETQFLKFYPQATASEKLLILTSLQKMESPHYFKLAALALADSNQSIVNGTISGLRRASASNAAVTLLQEALQKTDQSSTWNSIYSALVSIGTPEARQAIMKARHSGKIDEKKRAASTALNNIYYQRSPAKDYLKQGDRLQSSKDWESAIKEYQTAISIDYLMVPAYLGIANSKNGLKQYEDALKSADQGLEIDDMHSRLYVTKGLILSNQSQSTEALKEFNKAIELAPLDSFPYTVLASHYAKHQQNKEALETYDAAIKANPLSMKMYEFKADLQLSLKNPEAAIKTYDRAIKANPRHMESYVHKISILQKMKQYERALAVCDEILKRDNDSIYATLTKAFLFQNLGRLDDALAACDTAIQFKPQYLPSYITKAQILTKAEKWDGALAVYDQIINLNNRYLDAYTGRGHINLQKSDWQAAQKDFQKAFELNKKSSQAITGLAICMVYNHEDDKAIAFVQEHLKGFEHNGLFQYNVACVYGRALINLKEQPQTPDVQKRTKAYQEKAIAHLTSASQYDMQDVDWMQKDPDLGALQQLPAFRSLVQTIQKQSGENN